MIAGVAHRDDTQFRVLIVDDDATILGLLKELVSMVPDVKVFTAASPEEAMKLAVGENIDIIFTDVHMPGVTGLEMIQDFISLQKTPEVVVMTAFPSGDIATKAMEVGAAALLSKPFEDISIVELELNKAIKKILRQRAAAEEVSKKKEELSKRANQEADNDPILKISLGESVSVPDPTPSLLTCSSQPPDLPRDEIARPVVAERKVYAQNLIEPFVEVEIRRSLRNKKQFSLGMIEIPQNTQANSDQERVSFRQSRLFALQACFRNSDCLFDFDGESIAAIAFECNKTGAEVLEFKLAQAGFEFNGFATFQTNADDLGSLLEKSRMAVNEKRKTRIILLEPDEFFGRVVHNMLSDPRYHVVWARDYVQAYKEIQTNAELMKIGILSLSQDPKQWELLARMKKEALVNFPLILFTDVALSEALKAQLQALGVRAIVRKGAGHEEFLYVIQSFIMQSSAIVARKNPRALVTIPLIYKTEAAEVSSNSFTVSRDGIFIRELNPLPTGTKLKVELLIPGRKTPLNVSGEVIYSVPYFIGVTRIHVPGMAIKFMDLKEPDQQELDKFIASTLTSYLIG